MKIYMAKDLPSGTVDSAKIVQRVSEKKETLDSIYLRLSDEEKLAAWKSALTRSQNMQDEYAYHAITSESTNAMLRRHKIEAHKKFTQALACLLFFFIGAPLGAIIRKGGLGIPVVVSVVFFIFYYMVNTGGEKMAKTGQWDVITGVWLSSAILFVIGMFLINRANKDSVVFNIEGYRAFFQRVLGLRAKRRINRKEVIIDDPDYSDIKVRLAALVQDCQSYTERARLRLMPNYWRLYFRYHEDHEVIDIDERLEQLVKELHNSRDSVILVRLNELPILVPDAHTRPFHNARRNVFVGVFLPLGIFFFFRIWRYRLRLWRDMQQIQKIGTQINDRIIKEYIPNNG